MDPISTLTVAIGLVDAVLKTGKSLYEKVSAYKHAREEVLQEFIRFQGAWLKILEELEILRCILHTLETALVQHFTKQLDVLQLKLDAARSRVEKFMGERGIKNRFSYALLLKDPLRTAVDDLEQWTARFYPSWFSTARTLKEGLQKYLPNNAITQSHSAKTLENLRSVLATAKSNKNHESAPSILRTSAKIINTRSIDFSTAQIATEIENGLENLVIVDEAQGNTDDITNLGTKLATVEEASYCGLLKCRKVLRDEQSSDPSHEYSFIFEFPSEFSEAQSLRDLLLSCSMPPLDDRFYLAKLLARSIMFVHSYEFVHKDVRPETNIVFRKDTRSFGGTCLTGFKEFRSDSGQTKLEQTDEWEKNLYRHPSRQGLRPGIRYTMQHDIYSLGVCLLELGLWTSFIIFDRATGSVLGPAELLQINDLLSWADKTTRAYEIKNILLKIAKEMLPGRMGNRYTNVVLTCLTAWEDQSKDSKFGAKGDFASATEVGVRYSEKVLLELEEISL